MSDDEKTVPCHDCGEPVGIVYGPNGEEWPEWQCGRCGVPLYQDCLDASDWMYDGGYCCIDCNYDLDYGEVL